MYAITKNLMKNYACVVVFGLWCSYVVETKLSWWCKIPFLVYEFTPTFPLFVMVVINQKTDQELLEMVAGTTPKRRSSPSAFSCAGYFRVHSFSPVFPFKFLTLTHFVKEFCLLQTLDQFPFSRQAITAASFVTLMDRPLTVWSHILFSLPSHNKHQQVCSLE